MDYDADLGKCGFGSANANQHSRRSKPRKKNNFPRHLLDERDEP